VAFSSFDVKRGNDGTLGSSKSTIYTAPATGRGSIVISIYLVNTQASDTINVEIYRKTTVGTSKHISGDPTVMRPAGQSGAVNILQQGPVFLEPGDSIEGEASSASVVEYSISALELQ
jgi:hypothetical protein